MLQQKIITIQCENIDQSIIKDEIRAVLEAMFKRVDPGQAVQKAIQHHQDEIFIQSAIHTIEGTAKDPYIRFGESCSNHGSRGEKSCSTGVTISMAHVITKHSDAIQGRISSARNSNVREGDHPVPTIRSQNAVRDSLDAR